jgi:hypothetical protein
MVATMARYPLEEFSQRETRNPRLETVTYRPLIYFTASVAATYPVIEPRMRPEPLG